MEGGAVIDPARQGGVAFMANHACPGEASCEVQMFSTPLTPNGQPCLVPLRDLQPGEELTWDYKAKTEDDDDLLIPCLCGGSACQGTFFRKEEEEEE